MRNVAASFSNHSTLVSVCAGGAAWHGNAALCVRMRGGMRMRAWARGKRASARASGLSGELLDFALGVRAALAARWRHAHRAGRHGNARNGMAARRAKTLQLARTHLARKLSSRASFARIIIIKNGMKKNDLRARASTRARGGGKISLSLRARAAARALPRACFCARGAHRHKQNKT